MPLSTRLRSRHCHCSDTSSLAAAFVPRSSSRFQFARTFITPHSGNQLHWLLSEVTPSAETLQGPPKCLSSNNPTPYPIPKGMCLLCAPDYSSDTLGFPL